MRLLLVLTAATAILYTSMGVSASSSSAAPGAGAADVRAVWVLRTSLTSPAAVESMVARVAGAGFNTVLVQVRGRGEAYYDSAIDPRAADVKGPAGFDPLALTIERAHAAGLSVHAWVNVNLVSSAVTLPAASSHVVRRHPEWLMVPSALAKTLGAINPASPEYLASLARWTRGELDSVEGLYLSPVLPGAQDYSVSVVEELVTRYALDGIHLDYIRFPGSAFDYSTAALSAFRASRLPHATPGEIAALDSAARRDPAAWAARLPEAWGDFRRARITELVERLARVARTARPGIVLSAAVVPDADEARRNKGQDWSAWARDGLLDVVCPMAYTTEPEVFARQIASVAEASGSARVWAGVGAYRLTAQQAVRHIRLARESGTAGVALFSYDSMAADRRSAAYFARLRDALDSEPKPR